MRDVRMDFQLSQEEPLAGVVACAILIFVVVLPLPVRSEGCVMGVWHDCLVCLYGYHVWLILQTVSIQLTHGLMLDPWQYSLRLSHGCGLSHSRQCLALAADRGAG